MFYNSIPKRELVLLFMKKSLGQMNNSVIHSQLKDVNHNYLPYNTADIDCSISPHNNETDTYTYNDVFDVSSSDRFFTRDSNYHEDKTFASALCKLLRTNKINAQGWIHGDCPISEGCQNFAGEIMICDPRSCLESLSYYHC